MNDFKALIQLIIDKAQARNEVDKTIKDLQKAAQEQAIETGLKINKSDVKNVQKDLKGVSSAVTKLVSDSQRLSKTNTIKTWADNNSKAMKLLGADINGVLDKLRNPNLSRTGFKEINAEFEQIKFNAREAGLLGKTVGDSFKDMGSKFVSWVTVSGGIMTAITGLKKMKDAVIEIDTAMTNLYKVTDETSSKYNNFLEKANANAQKLGRSVSSLITQAAEWAKLGFSIDKSAELAQVSSIYANVGEVDDKTAVSDMVTAMKAFNVQASDSILIIDKLNALGNQYAVSSADLGEGLRNSASALALAGNDIDQSLAMITAMSEVTQNASESGNALKILSMRLRGMKGELEALGEESDGIESISKIQTQLLNLSNNKVNIFDDHGNFKSTYEIMKDIANVWESMSQVDQADMLEIIAGKQRGNSIAALLTNMSQAQNALDSSVESSGSAYAEQEKWMQSIEAKAGQFEAAFQSLSNTVIDSELVKFFVDLGTTGVKGLDSLASAIKYINSLGGNISSIGGTLGALSGLLMNKTGMGKLYRAPLYIGLQYLAM
ncbi:phage tail tape measure protein [Lacrimispora indolis]|uniref:phage tail tape measure protein n=1 Tax=Lacrimispora indolis TaxID=69825 RepID=UPI000417CD4D|nr:phage tail tape measure protein [[Clostridium] methoxybenzovorans]